MKYPSLFSKLIALSLAAILVVSCVSITPTPPPAATAAPTVQPTVPVVPSGEPPVIPAPAWSRGIGVPYAEAGKPNVDYDMIDDGPWAGVPLGGLGAGSIGRTYRGDFARWHLDVGAHHFESLPANQFSVFIAQGADTQAHVLSPLNPDTLSAWNWDMPTGAGTYYALFPKAWFDYEWDALPAHLTQMQFSPVIPGNYQESSYPVGVFEWTVANPTDQPLTVGLMFTWQNLVGWPWSENPRAGNYNYTVSSDSATGVVLTRAGDSVSEEWDGSFAIAAPQQPGLALSYRTRFDAADGADVWTDFAADGSLENVDDQEPSQSGESIGAALVATIELNPGETRNIPFALAWDFPITEFGSGTQWYKRYTRFYGATGREAFTIAADALARYPEWEAAIDAWQKPILDDPDRPDWYKTALFNELYYLVDGGTAWEAGQVGEPSTGESIGRFAYLECFDYIFYNTFDVHFYGSAALLQLWPELEKSLIRDFVAAVPAGDPAEMMVVQSTGESAQRKVPGMAPHDIGGPGEDPWLKPNAYVWRDINIWKDLNSKFVLQLWSDYVYTQDAALVHDGWPAAVQALDALHAFDADGDGLPDHAGVPDQTYDDWVMSGASAYTGGLWLAALEAAIEMGELEGDTANVQRYTDWLETGKATFEAKLWNGTYYNYDSSGGSHSDSIMADQLAGQWRADMAGLAPIAPDDHIASALKTVYENNVMRFADGEMGAVNGMRPDGAVDMSSAQSSEVWVGTTYALAASMIHRGLLDAAWATAWGAYNVTYNRGYWFRTPEAYNLAGDFRASMYMRPLSIWAMEHALNETTGAAGR
ncbi:MAG TPA: non-lysosomal glucosylceramidase [Anaerolineae bacterium]|nr:non-lysosomal glucosylceramidase [Anaerolineae bacterium]